MIVGDYDQLVCDARDCSYQAVVNEEGWMIISRIEFIPDFANVHIGQVEIPFHFCPVHAEKIKELLGSMLR